MIKNNTVLFFVLIILIAFAATSFTTNAHAASAHSSATCQLTYKLNIGTTREQTIHTACFAGSSITNHLFALPAATGCGKTSSISAGWDSPNDSQVYYQAYAAYERTVDCRSTYIYDLYIVNNGPGKVYLSDAEYNGSDYDFPGSAGCQPLDTGKPAYWNPQLTVQYGHGLTWWDITKGGCFSFHTNEYFSMGYLL